MIYPPIDGRSGPCLWSLTEKHASDKEVHEFQFLRPVSAEEVEAFRLALRWHVELFTAEGVLSDVAGELEDLKDRIGDSLVAMTTEPDHGRSAAPRVLRGFSNWLAWFASFDPKISDWLAHEVGKESGAYLAFKEALSLEWDSNSAYRYASQLRNISLHSRARSLGASRIDFRDGSWELVLSFRPAQLAEEHGSRMNAKVRDEWLAAAGEVHALTLAIHATNGCHRALGKLVAALGDELDVKQDFLATLVEECGTGDGKWAVVADFDHAYTEDLQQVNEAGLQIFARVRGELETIGLNSPVYDAEHLFVSPDLTMPTSFDADAPL